MRFKSRYIVLIVFLLALVILFGFQNIEEDFEGELGSFSLFQTSEVVSVPFNLYVNDSFNKIYNNVGKEEFSKLLADVDLSVGKITQNIILGSDPNFVFKRQPTIDRDPSLGLRISDDVSKEFYKLELDFDENDELVLNDLVGEEIILFDKKFEVSPKTESSLREGDKIQITRITDNEFDQRDAKIYGDYIVWTDNRNGNQDIYMYNLVSEEETRITDNPEDQFRPLIYGNKIVWNDKRNGNSDVYMYDIILETVTPVADNELNEVIGAIEGDLVAVNVYKNEWIDPDIFIYNLTTSLKVQITDDSSEQYATDIYKNKLVYLNRSQFDLEHQTATVYDLESNEILLGGFLTRSPPHIFGDKLIGYRYGDITANTADIFIYDLATSTEEKITDNPTKRHTGDIGMDFAAWYEFGDDSESANIYVYDLLNDREILLTDDEFRQDEPDIYQRKVIWNDNQNGNYDIYLAEIDFDNKLVIMSEDDEIIYG